MPLSGETVLHHSAGEGDATALRAALKEGGCELDGDGSATVGDAGAV